MTRNTPCITLALAATLVVGAVTTSAAKIHHPSPAAQATVSMKTARALALSRVPGGRIRTAELEREGGKLIYSFDVVTPGKSGIDEVNVNAVDRTDVVVHHESPQAEKAEARKDAAEKQKSRVK